MPVPRQTVTVVEDDLGFRRALERLIRAHGYSVESVATLTELRSRLLQSETDCVLADIILDGESGLDIPSILAETRRVVPIIFMTATDDQDKIKAADTAGHAPCLRKPFEATDLFIALESAMAGGPVLHMTPDATE